jgi:hypothetical protein
MSGFGPVFAECVLLSGFLLLVFGWRAYRTAAGRYLLLTASVLALSVCIFPESWYSRYVPQLYMMLLIVLVAIHHSCGNLRVAHVWPLAFLLITNVWLIAYPYFNYQRAQSNMVRNELLMLAKRSGRAPIDVYPGWLQSQLVRLDEAGIRYNLVFDMRKEEAVPFAGTEGQSAYRK